MPQESSQLCVGLQYVFENSKAGWELGRTGEEGLRLQVLREGSPRHQFFEHRKFPAWRLQLVTNLLLFFRAVNLPKQMRYPLQLQMIT